MRTPRQRVEKTVVISSRKIRLKSGRGAYLLTLLAALCPATVWADQAPEPSATGGPLATGGRGGEPTEALGDIIVSAQRTNVTLQEASLSVSAVSADTLQKGGVTEITGLNGSVPGLVIARSGGGERLISIRGVGSETPVTPRTQPGVSLHVDGVYIFNSIAAAAAFIDVEQVEVLRGPQGTMYGQGSTGGTINIVSKAPEQGELSGSVNVARGNYDLFKADAALNVPVGDTVAVRGAIQRHRHEGYARAIDVAGNPDYGLDDADEWGGKLAISWRPADGVSVLLSTIQYRGDNHATAQKNILDPNPDPRALTQDYPGKTFIRTQLYYGVVKFDLGGATFSSITGYQRLNSRLSWDSDGLNPALFQALTDSVQTGAGVRYDHTALWQQTTTSWTQEYNLASDGTGPFRWILGGVYLRSKNRNYINEYRGTAGDGLNAALPADADYNNPLVQDLTYAELSEIVREAYAGYAQASYDLTDRLSATAGLRYNHDRYSGVSDALSGGMTGSTSGAYLRLLPGPGASTKRVTGKFALDYELTPSNMVYASFTRGFKPGGINNTAAQGGSSYSIFGFENGVRPAFKPETLDSIEAGSKNRFFGNTLQINASVFYYVYKNLQFLEEDAVLFAEGIANVPRADVYGAEVEVDWKATPHLRLEGSLSFLRGKLTSDYFALDPAAADAAQAAAGYAGVSGFYDNFGPATFIRESMRENIKGNRVPKMPAVQGTIAASWTGDVGPGAFTGRVQYIYRGKFNSRIFARPVQDETPAYSQVNLFARYDFADTGLSASMTVTNLFDKAGINARFTDPYGSSQVSDTYIPPRQAALSLGYRF